MIYNTKYDRSEMLDLNEENVKKVFTYCLATNQTPKNNIRVYSFFSDECKVNVPKIPFDETKLNEMNQTILYLLGQFENLHTKNGLLFLSDGFKKYDGTTWTTDKMALFSLYYLGVATQNLPRFIPSRIPNQFDTILAKIPYLKPTLSPNDSNFEKWCIENDKLK